MESEYKMLYFKAVWCGPCKVSSPIVEQLQQESETTGFEIEIINVDDQPEMSAEYGVRSIPTFIFLKDGEEIDRQVGGMQKAGLMEKFNGLK